MHKARISSAVSLEGAPVSGLVTRRGICPARVDRQFFGVLN